MLREIDLNDLYELLDITFFDLYEIAKNKMKLAVVGISTDTGNYDILANDAELRTIAEELRNLLEKLYKKLYIEEKITNEEFDKEVEKFAEKHKVNIYRILEYDTVIFVKSKGVFKGKRVKKVTILKRIHSLKQLEMILMTLREELEPLFMEWGFNP